MTSLGSGYSFVPGAGGLSAVVPGAPAGDTAARFDMLINPVTLDYVRTANGQWEEIADSRTKMLLQLELELDASPFTPSDGTRLAALRRAGEPITPGLLLGEARRAATLLARAGVLADLAVEIQDSAGARLVDLAGRPAVVITWRDLSSGLPVDLVFQPR